MAPAGTTTFLFTDIEGSTRLWEARPQAMRAALARHDVLLRAAIEGRGGTVFKTVGDAFCAVFDSAAAAVAAALEAQRVLTAENWGAFGADFAPLQVRMALHTGEAEARDDDWFGPPLNQVARLLAVGHGGQVLLSEVVEGLVAGRLPVGAGLKDLGEHRLKDLSRPGKVFQLLGAGLVADFPALHSLDAHPQNLPAQSTSFVGREAEVQRVKELMARTRLLTLTGFGGSGKTRLAIQAAAELLEGCPDGAWLVELAPLADGALLSQAVATVLGLREEGGRGIEAVLLEHLRERRLLLILDNCEHQVEASAALVARLLRSAPHLQILATSRVLLGVSGEVLWTVPPLASPEEGSGPRSAAGPAPEELLRYAAPRLFVERARAVRPDFSLSAANAADVLAICRGLDGIPLAIELAASRVRAMSPEQIAARLGQRFQLLRGGDRGARPQQQTLQAALDWSHDLLDARDHVLFRRLSIFAGGWTLEKAEAICADSEADGGLETIAEFEVLDLFSRLLDHSLVAADPEAARHRMLETVRAYARARLEASGELPALAARHAATFLALAEEAEPGLSGAGAAAWLERLDLERANLRAALAWALEQGATLPALRLSGALWRYWYLRGSLTEGRLELERALALPGADAAGIERAKALHGAGTLAGLQGDFAAARRLLADALQGWRDAGDAIGERRTVNNLAVMVHEQGDYAAARPLFEACLVGAGESGDAAALAMAHNNLASVALELGDLAAAEEGFQAALTLERRLGNTEGCARALRELGATALDQGRLERAKELVQEGMALSGDLGDRRALAEGWSHLGEIAQRLGDLAAAREAFHRSLDLEREMSGQRGIAIAQTLLGLLALEAGDLQEAGRCLAAGREILEGIGHPRSLASALTGLGQIALRGGDPSAARPLLSRALALRRAMGSPLHLAASLEAVAELARAEGHGAEARTLVAAAQAVRQRLGAPLAPARRRELDALGAADGDATAAEDVTAALSLDEAVALAVRLCDAQQADGPG